MFKGCNRLKKITLKNVDSIGNIIETTSMFEGCTSLTVVNFENMNINNMNSTSKMFKDCINLNKININDFSTEKTKDMSQMFGGCSSLTDIKFIERLSTNNSEKINEMFSGCSKITSLHLDRFNTSNVKDMSGMFKGMINLKDLYIYYFDTKNVLYMNEIFKNCASIESLNLSNFNTDNVINMDMMFAGCSSLESLDLSSFNVAKCDINKEVFKNTKDILMQNLNNKKITDILGIKVNSETIGILIEGKNETGRMRNLQESGEMIKLLGDSFDEFNPDNTFMYIDGNKFDFDKNIYVKSSTTVKVILKFSQKIMTFKEMFSGCQRIREVSLQNIETELIIETTSMFEGCSSLSGVKFENMSIYNVTSTAKMFQKCSSLNKIEIETFSTNKAKDMSRMFDGCSSFENNTFLEGLSTDSAESMDEMFSGCSEIKSLNLSGFNTSNAKNMSGMFKGMISLKDLEISSFNTDKVEYMSEMFENCSSIKSLDLSNFNTEKVITMDRMFSSCLKLEEINITSFKLTSCNSTEYMFSNTTRELMLSIEKNEQISIHAGKSWSQSEKQFNFTRKPLDLLFLVDATGSMLDSIRQVKEKIIYISALLLNKTGMDIYDLYLGAVFYRDPVDESTDVHQFFDFDKNPFNFKFFTSQIIASGGGDGPEDWAGAFYLSKNLSWQNDSFKFIVHIADAPAHGLDWANPYYDGDLHPYEGIRTDNIITYFAQNNFSIAGFKVKGEYPSYSFKRAQTLYRNNSNFNYFFRYFDECETDNDYFLNLVHESFLKILNVEHLKGIDVSEEQGDINWEIVKNENEIDFVIIRAGIGNERDTKFEKNYEDAKKFGIHIGIYWTAKAFTQMEAKNEAEACKNIIKGKTFELPIYYVIDDDEILNTINEDAILNSFYENLNSSNTTNYLCGLGSSKFRGNFMPNLIDKYQIWNINSNEEYKITEVDYNIWRYNEEGTIAGIDGKVALDKSIINYAKITSENNYNGY